LIEYACKNTVLKVLRMEVLSNINIIFYLVAYIVGSIPFGYILAKIFADVDIKNEGSGNIGATNVLRVLKKHNPKMAKKLGAATLLLDAAKGAVVILAAKFFGIGNEVLWTIAILAVWGHCFSVFMNFEGGKGVATGLGVFAIMLPVSALLALIVWFVAAKTIKISSLSSTVALVALVALSYLIYPDTHGLGTHAPIWIIALTVIYKHIPNYVRLLQKEEIPV